MLNAATFSWDPWSQLLHPAVSKPSFVMIVSCDILHWHLVSSTAHIEPHARDSSRDASRQTLKSRAATRTVEHCNRDAKAAAENRSCSRLLNTSLCARKAKAPHLPPCMDCCDGDGGMEISTWCPQAAAALSCCAGQTSPGAALLGWSPLCSCGSSAPGWGIAWHQSAQHV